MSWTKTTPMGAAGTFVSTAIVRDWMFAVGTAGLYRSKINKDGTLGQWVLVDPLEANYFFVNLVASGDQLFFVGGYYTGPALPALAISTSVRVATVDGNGDLGPKRVVGTLPYPMCIPHAFLRERHLYMVAPRQLGYYIRIDNRTQAFTVGETISTPSGASGVVVASSTTYVHVINWNAVEVVDNEAITGSVSGAALINGAALMSATTSYEDRIWRASVAQNGDLGPWKVCISGSIASAGALANCTNTDNAGQVRNYVYMSGLNCLYYAKCYGDSFGPWQEISLGSDRAGAAVIGVDKGVLVIGGGTARDVLFFPTDSEGKVTGLRKTTAMTPFVTLFKGINYNPKTRMLYLVSETESYVNKVDSNGTIDGLW